VLTIVAMEDTGEMAKADVDPAPVQVLILVHLQTQTRVVTLFNNSHMRSHGGELLATRMYRYKQTAEDREGVDAATVQSGDWTGFYRTVTITVVSCHRTIWTTAATTNARAAVFS
jgi:hypothetical protein